MRLRHWLLALSIISFVPVLFLNPHSPFQALINLARRLWHFASPNLEELKTEKNSLLWGIGRTPSILLTSVQLDRTFVSERNTEKMHCAPWGQISLCSLPLCFRKFYVSQSRYTPPVLPAPLLHTPYFHLLIADIPLPSSSSFTFVLFRLLLKFSKGKNIRIIKCPGKHNF